MDASTELHTTPLNQRHIDLGARMVPFAGYSMPLQYSGLVKEHQAVRGAAGIFDVCHMGEIRVRGAEAISFVNSLVTNDLERIKNGQAMYSCACRADGGIVDDLIVYRISDDNLLIVCNASNRQKVWQHLNQQLPADSDVRLEDESDDTALLALQGPLALQILGEAEASLAQLKDELPTFRFAERNFAGVTVTIARTGYTGEDGVEIFCPQKDAGTVWDALLKAGTPLGLLPAGLGCRDTLRLEARLSLYGQELNDDITPLEAGLAWTVKLDKQSFLGKEVLEAQKAGALKKRLVGFEMIGRGAARPEYELLNKNGEKVGVCSSGGPSPSLGKAIGLGFLPLDMTDIGTEFLVNCRGKHIAARVVKTPFYKRS